MNRFNKLIRLNYKIFTQFGGGYKCLYISAILSRILRVYYHCDIPSSVNVNGIYFNHRGFGVVINPLTKLGNNINIQHSVTIGIKYGDDAPTIEDDVVIGAKSTLIGNIRIGKGSIIGAGSVVTKDVPPYSVVVGNPGRIIKTLNH